MNKLLHCVIVLIFVNVSLFAITPKIINRDLDTTNVENVVVEKDSTSKIINVFLEKFQQNKLVVKTFENTGSGLVILINSDNKKLKTYKFIELKDGFVIDITYLSKGVYGLEIILDKGALITGLFDK